MPTHIAHTPWQNIRLLYEFHWDELKHLKHRFEINFVLLALCFTLVSDHLEISTHTNSHSCIHPIRIQVYFTKNTQNSFFLVPNHKGLQRFPSLRQLKLRTCKSRVKSVVMCWDIFFLACINLMTTSSQLHDFNTSMVLSYKIQQACDKTISLLTNQSQLWNQHTNCKGA